MGAASADIHDLTHLVGPLTEESLVKCLQTRHSVGLCETLIGPQLVCVNPYTYIPSPNVFHNGRYESSATFAVNQSQSGTIREDNSPHTMAAVPAHRHGQSELTVGVVSSALSQHADSSQPQVILLSGESGSGKTECAMRVLRQLFQLAGGGTETDSFKFLSAALTVLKSLGTAGTLANHSSSRLGMYIENLTSDGLVYRTKIHSLLIDSGRVTRVPRREKNYVIFYQMLAGLSADEKVKLHLSGFTPQNLSYLSEGSLHPGPCEDKTYFEAWKASLAVMGIPVSDVLRVLASVLLLGNVQFIEGMGQELEVVGNNELKSVAALLGVSGVSLYRGFTTQTRVSHGQVCRTITDATTANTTRNTLGRSLYFRTLSAILRRINSMKRRTSHCTQSTESLESRGSSQYNNKPDILNPSLPSFLGLSLSMKSSESFIGILDLFGFETAEVNALEQMCINLCAEAMQHYYNTHVFRSPAEALHEEGIQPEVDVNYFNNTPVIELLSAQTHGLLSILDRLTPPVMSAQDYVQEMRSQHTANNYFFEPLPKNDRLFGIRHFTGRVVYDASSFLSTNHDQLPDDVIHVFARQNCNFGFVSHLFSAEIKPAPDGIPGPRGLKYQTVPSSHQDGDSCNDVSHSTLSREFQCRLENILKSITSARPHFIRCIKSNDSCQPKLFECETVSRQVRSLQITDAVQLMAGGLPHRLRYKTFNTRYHLFQTHRRPQRRTEPPHEECKAILTQFLRAMDQSHLPYISTQWSLGRKHIFFSEGTRQSLEVMRRECLGSAAAKIQAVWRGFKVRKSLRALRRKVVPEQVSLNPAGMVPTTPRPQLPPKGEKIERVEPAVLHYVSKMWNIDLKLKPDVPPRRNYSIHGNVLITYPQCRCMKVTFPELGAAGQVFKKGDIVTVMGPSATAGHLIAQRGNLIHNVPFRLMDVQTVQETCVLAI